MIRETGVQFQVESYQRLKRWYLMLPCLTLSIIRYGSRVKWNNPGNGVAHFPTPWYSSYRKRSFRVTLDYVLHYVGGPPRRRSLCLFWRDSRQRVWTRDLDATGSRKRTRVGSWTKEHREGGWRRVTWVASRRRTVEVTSQHERESSSSEGRPVKMSQHSSSFVEI